MGGLVIGGLQSSSGKTVVTCLLLAALAKRGRTFQPFKAGPDFIDPAYHTLFSPRPSRNLDFWLLGGEQRVRGEVSARTSDCPGIVEGVMGLFDGWSPNSDSESTVHLARALSWPVVLVVPCAKAGRSVAAALRGFIEEAEGVTIAGVILNQVSGDSHREYLREALRPLQLPVLGSLPVDAMMAWPERHLGLRAAQEGDFFDPDEMAAMAEANLDVEALWSLTQSVENGPEDGGASDENAERERHRLRLGVARDEAFHFYYPWNLEAFEILPFSPLRDRSLPDEVDALALGGGFPELFAEELCANTAMRQELAGAVCDGIPVLAECGGFMYLGEELTAADGKSYPMCGAVPGRFEMMDRLQHFGYCTGGGPETRHGLPPVTGHEFHHSRWLNEDSSANLWQVSKRRSGRSRIEGYRTRNLFGTYVHSRWTPDRFTRQSA